MNLISRTLTIICISTLFAACGGGGGNDSPEPDTPAKVTPDSPTPPEPGPTEPEPEPPTPKSVTLSWNTPSARANGDPLPLSEIGGYEVYYFEEQTQQGDGNTIRIPTPDTNEVTIPSLMPGTYHFAVVSFDTEGLYSEISEYVTATVL